MSTSADEMFDDRWSAGRALGAKVAGHLRSTGALPDLARPTGGAPGRPLVLALPRGGVPVGYAVAEAIGADLDVTVARKIGLPWQPEFGIGAVTPHGPPLLNRRVLAQVGLTEEDLAPAVARERAEAVRRLRRYRGGRPEPALAGRVVVLVDDGLATGVTARAAVRSVRAPMGELLSGRERAGPERLLYAAPVCAADSAARLAAEADQVICVHCPADFGAVGAWYRDFTQVTDAEVEQLLADAWSGHGSAQAAVSHPPRRS